MAAKSADKTYSAPNTVAAKDARAEAQEYEDKEAGR